MHEHIHALVPLQLLLSRETCAVRGGVTGSGTPALATCRRLRADPIMCHHVSLLSASQGAPGSTATICECLGLLCSCQGIWIIFRLKERIQSASVSQNQLHSDRIADL
ncbi:hypothetical protein MHYP_G00332880 [Metynnis hypsauchen]